MAKRAAPHRGIDIHYGESGDGDSTAERPSKTQLKQKSHDLQDLGEQVAALSDARLARIEMPEALRDAIAEFRRTRSHEGKRRQLQYLGKLMRSADEAVLREAVAEATLGSARETLRLHETERWRDALIADDKALDTWLAEHPDTDIQQLRSLVRAARRDAALPPEKRQSRNHRELFQFLKPLITVA
ncbi:MAG: ribosome biogenesis factor YjgA [Rubrivivax sp.]